MKKTLCKISVIVLCIIISTGLSACSLKKASTDAKVAGYYIKVDNEEISKEYIGYFFFLAQKNMLDEAGMVLGDGGNSTEDDVKTYWKTTEIEGKSAVDVARNLAADNVVQQKMKYNKAVSEKIELSEEENQQITDDINLKIESNGGKEAFEKQLKSMNCNMKAYVQIMTENVYIRKLYEKYDSENKLEISENELAEFLTENDGKYSQDEIKNAAKVDKFNKMVKLWEKNADISINDDKMREFNV